MKVKGVKGVLTMGWRSPLPVYQSPRSRSTKSILPTPVAHSSRITRCLGSSTPCSPPPQQLIRVFVEDSDRCGSESGGGTSSPSAFQFPAAPAAIGTPLLVPPTQCQKAVVPRPTCSKRGVLFPGYPVETFSHPHQWPLCCGVPGVQHPCLEGCKPPTPFFLCSPQLTEVSWKLLFFSPPAPKPPAAESRWSAESNETALPSTSFVPLSHQPNTGKGRRGTDWIYSILSP